MFENKNILIIGGTSGIGTELVRKLNLANANIYLASRTANNLEGLQYVSHQTIDVTSAFQLENLPDKLDGLVYLPGTINLKPFSRISDEDILNEFNINALGAVRVIRQVLPKLKASEQSSIVLFSTVAFQVGMPFHLSIAIAKGAVEGITRTLAAELSPKVRVNAIAPSLTETPLATNIINTEEKRKFISDKNPMKHIGKPEEIAGLAKFLLSQEASWMTGQILSVDGGMSTLKL